MLQAKNILIVMHYSGNNGAIESYIYASALVMKNNGAKLWLAYSGEIIDQESSTSLFEDIFHYDAIPDIPFDLVLIHKIWDQKLLKSLLIKYESRAVMFIHDHSYYCPRQWKYFPICHLSCGLSYNFLRCACCGMIRKLSSWRKGLIGELGDKFIDFQDRLDLLRRFPHIVVTSQAMRDMLLSNNFSLESLHVIPPALVLPGCNNKHEEKESPCILFVGELIYPNGCDIFIKVLEQLKHKFTAKIIGTGEECNKLKRNASMKGLTDRVTFCGNIKLSEYKQILSEADLMLQPARWQVPFPLSAIEAASAAIPTIAFNVGSIGENVINDVTGILIKPNDIQAMAEATDKLLDNYQLRATLGNNAQSFSSGRFTPEQFMKGINRLLGY